MADLVGELQKVKTSIRRQMLDNLSFQNNQMWEVDRSVRPEYSSLLNPRPGGIVRVDRLGGLKPLTPPPLSNIAMQALEFEQSQLEQLTGVTRYNQGLDAKSLNKTATGISAIMGASQQRIELIARTFAETGVRELFRLMLALNQQFMDKTYSLRIYGESSMVEPDDIKGLFDISINVGISAGRQEETQQQMMQLLQMAPGLMQGGVMTPDNVYEVLKKLMSSWGHKDVDRYVSDPQYVQQMQQQMEQLGQQAQQMQQQLEQSQQLLQMLPPELLQQTQQQLQMMQQQQSMMQQQGAPPAQPQGMPPQPGGM
ncbi:MAG: hypothetical protein EOM01_09140 [Spirochaetia bacterium]|nr:hypothetical protein [Spirochaetia bacterium]